MRRFFATVLVIICSFCWAPLAEAAPVWLSCQASGAGGSISAILGFDEATHTANAVIGGEWFDGTQVTITSTLVSFYVTDRYYRERSFGIVRTDGHLEYYIGSFNGMVHMAGAPSFGSCSVTSAPTPPSRAF
jgi:hypothetical protein